MSDPAHRHGGPDAGWYIPDGHGWQRISDAEVWDHGDAAHFMSDPNGRHGEPPMMDPAAFLAQFDDPSLRAPIYGPPRRRLRRALLRWLTDGQNPPTP